MHDLSLRLTRPERLVAAMEQATLLRGRLPALILCHPDDLARCQAVFDAETRARQAAGRPLALPALAVSEHGTIQPGTLLLA